jgi:hypothetical protein
MLMKVVEVTIVVVVVDGNEDSQSVEPLLMLDAVDYR